MKGKFGLSKGQTAPAFAVTGEEGPYRFMAPEIFQRRQYDHKVDQYSWAMITYQLFTGIRPLSHLAPVDAAKAAAEGGARPALDEVCDPVCVQCILPQFICSCCSDDGPHQQEIPPRVRRLLANCWSSAPDLRPDFEEIVTEMEEICLEQKGKGSRVGEGCCSCFG